MQRIENAKLGLPRGIEDLQHIRNTVVRFGNALQAIPYFASLRNEVVIWIDRQKCSEFLVICHFRYAASNLCGNAKLAGNELLPAVDVVGLAREGRVGHDVYGERCDVGRSDDAPDGKRGAKLIAAVVEFIAEERFRIRCVDEAGGDGADTD